MELFSYNNLTNVGLPIKISYEDVFSQNEYSMYRIIYVRSGTGIVNINGISIVLISPSIICLNEGDKIVLEHMADVDAVIIYFSPRIVNKAMTLNNIRDNTEELLENYTNDFFYLYPFIKKTEDYKGLFEINFFATDRMNQLLDLLEIEIRTTENYYWSCRTRSFLLEILFFIQNILTDKKKSFDLEPVKDDKEVKKVILYLHTNYAKKITIKDLEGIFHINRTTLSERFKNTTGTTIKNYLINIRLKMAAMLLRDTLLPISDIAIRAGFTDTTHFTRSFKKKIGYLPSEYHGVGLKES